MFVCPRVYPRSPEQVVTLCQILTQFATQVPTAVSVGSPTRAPRMELVLGIPITAPHPDCLSAIRQLVAKHGVRDSRVYVGAAAPIAKRRNACGKYGGGALAPDDAVLLYDATLFGSATEGLLVTHRYIGFNSVVGRPACVRLCDVLSFEVVPSNEHAAAVVVHVPLRRHRVFVPRGDGDKRVLAATLALVLTEYVQWLRGFLTLDPPQVEIVPPVRVQSRAYAARAADAAVPVPSSAAVEAAVTEPSTAVVQPSAASVEPLAAGVEVIAAVVQPTAADVGPSAAGVQPSAADVGASAGSALPSPQPPVAAVEAAVAVSTTTSASVEPSAAIVEASAASAQPSAAIVEASAASVHPPGAAVEAVTTAAAVTVAAVPGSVEVAPPPPPPPSALHVHGGTDSEAHESSAVAPEDGSGTVEAVVSPTGLSTVSLLPSPTAPPTV